MIDETAIKIEKTNNTYWCEVTFNQQRVNFSNTNHELLLIGAVKKFIDLYNDNY